MDDKKIEAEAMPAFRKTFLLDIVAESATSRTIEWPCSIRIESNFCSDLCDTTMALFCLDKERASTEWQSKERTTKSRNV